MSIVVWVSLPSRALPPVTIARETPDPYFLVYTDPVSIINASAQSFGLAYIDALSFSFVSLMLSSCTPTDAPELHFSIHNYRYTLLRAATTAALRRVLQIHCTAGCIGLHAKKRCTYCNC